MFNLKSLTNCSCSAVIHIKKAVSSIKVTKCDNLYLFKNHFCVDIHIHTTPYPPVALATPLFDRQSLLFYNVLLAKLLLLLCFYTDTSSIKHKKVLYLCHNLET